MNHLWLNIEFALTAELDKYISELDDVITGIEILNSASYTNVGRVLAVRSFDINYLGGFVLVGFPVMFEIKNV